MANVAAKLMADHADQIDRRFEMLIKVVENAVRTPAGMTAQ